MLNGTDNECVLVYCMKFFPQNLRKKNLLPRCNKTLRWLVCLIIFSFFSVQSLWLMVLILLYITKRSIETLGTPFPVKKRKRKLMSDRPYFCIYDFHDSTARQLHLFPSWWLINYSGSNFYTLKLYFMSTVEVGVGSVNTTRF